MTDKSVVVFECEGLYVNYLEQVVSYKGKEIYFTNREFQTIYLLLQYQGQVLSKKQIYEQTTGDGERVDYHTVETTISRIRKKIEICSGEILLSRFGKGDINLKNRAQKILLAAVYGSSRIFDIN